MLNSPVKMCGFRVFTQPRLPGAASLSDKVEILAKKCGETGRAARINGQLGHAAKMPACVDLDEHKDVRHICGADVRILNGCSSSHAMNDLRLET